MSIANEQKQGVIYATLAFVMWGLAPIYFKLIAQIQPLEILVHRVVWSFVLMVLVIGILSKWQEVKAVLQNRTTLMKLALAAGLLCTNWGIFIWSVTSDHILDASLGYYINPLLNILLGVMFLGEKLKKLQGVAVALATTGVLIQVVSFGSFPFVAVSLAFSFAIYGLIRKTVAVDSLTGMLIESAILLPIAFLYWGMFIDSPTANLFANSWQLVLLLIGTGVVTTLPLLCFTAGARRIKYSTMGFLQYIGPSMMFILALVVYQEEVGPERWITFGFIWLALILFSWDSMRKNRSPITLS